MKQLSYIHHQLTGHYFYFALTLILINWLLLSRYTILILLLLAYWCYRCYCLRDGKLCLWLLVVLIIGIIYFIPVVKQVNRSYQEHTQWTSGVIYPDTLSVNGNIATFQAKTAQGRIKARVVLASEQEKQLLMQGKLLSFAGEGEWNNGEKERNFNGFNERIYLLQHHLKANVYLKKVTLSPAQWTSPSLWLAQQREKCICRIQQKVPATLARYILGLVIGYKTADFDNQMYQKLGIIHLFSLSGTHIAILLLCLRYVLLRCSLSREHCWWVEGSLLFLYFIFTGMMISVWRSGMQNQLRSLNQRFSLEFTKVDIWSLSLILGLCVYPVMLCTAAGILTYGLSLALIVSDELFTGYTHKAVYQSLLMLWASVPVLARYFSEIPLAGVFLNLICLPLFSLLIPVLYVAAISVLLFPSMTVFLSSLNGSLVCFEMVLGQLQHLAITPVIGVLTSFSLLCWLFVWVFWSRRVWWLSLFLVSLVLHSWWIPLTKVSFIDVGQGDSILIQFPYHRGNYLIDTGGKVHCLAKQQWKNSQSKHSNAEMTVIPYLKSEGIQRLDAIFLTHADADHMGDIQEVAKAFHPKAIYYPQGCDHKESFVKKLAPLRHFCRCQPVLAPKTLAGKQAVLQLIEPTHAGNGDNDHSLVCLLQIGKTNFLFTGDLGKEGEVQLMKDYPQLKVDVLKVGHHGSKHSSSSAFIKQLQPKWGVISCGQHNRFHHPHQEVIEHLQAAQVNLLRTDEQGQIQFIFMNQQLIKIKTAH